MATPDASRTGWALGNNSGAVNRDGRPAKASQPADGVACAAAADSAAARPRGRPRRPPPVPENARALPEEAAVRARLLKVDATCVHLAPGSSRWTYPCLAVPYG